MEINMATIRGKSAVRTSITGQAPKREMAGDGAERVMEIVRIGSAQVGVSSLVFGRGRISFAPLRRVRGCSAYNRRPGPGHVGHFNSRNWRQETAEYGV